VIHPAVHDLILSADSTAESVQSPKLRYIQVQFSLMGRPGLIAAAAIVLIAFLRQELRAIHPLLDVRLFLNRSYIAGASLITLYREELPRGPTVRHP
jgi:hypothetical protein